MDYNFYLNKFQKAADRLDKEKLSKKQLEVGVGIVLDSVFLKLYKKQWTSDRKDPMNATTRIFFSVWVNEKTIKENKIAYNIHALKLRQLKGYSISSRDFADRFRKDFKRFQNSWKNINIKLGPLTLMEGWEYLNEEDLENIIVNLASNFLEIDFLIDNTLQTFKCY